MEKRPLIFRANVDGEIMHFDLSKKDQQNGFFGDCVCGEWDIDEYTSFNDVDGVKIFENDEIEFDNTPHDDIKIRIRDTVVFRDYQFVLKDRDIPLRALLGCFGPVNKGYIYNVRLINQQ